MKPWTHSHPYLQVTWETDSRTGGDHWNILFPWPYHGSRPWRPVPCGGVVWCAPIGALEAQGCHSWMLLGHFLPWWIWGTLWLPGEGCCCWKVPVVGSRNCFLEVGTCSPDHDTPAQSRWAAVQYWGKCSSYLGLRCLLVGMAMENTSEGASGEEGVKWQNFKRVRREW